MKGSKEKRRNVSGFIMITFTSPLSRHFNSWDKSEIAGETNVSMLLTVIEVNLWEYSIVNSGKVQQENIMLWSTRSRMCPYCFLLYQQIMWPHDKIDIGFLTFFSAANFLLHFTFHSTQTPTGSNSRGQEIHQNICALCHPFSFLTYILCQLNGIG